MQGPRKLQEWGVAFFVTWGVTQFLLTGPIATESGENEDHTSNSVKGESYVVHFAFPILRLCPESCTGTVL